MSEKHDYENGVEISCMEKADIADEISLEETEPENSKIEAVRLGKFYSLDIRLIAFLSAAAG